MEKLTDLIKNHPENPVNPVKKKNLPKVKKMGVKSTFDPYR